MADDTRQGSYLYQTFALALASLHRRGTNPVSSAKAGQSSIGTRQMLKRHTNTELALAQYNVLARHKDRA